MKTEKERTDQVCIIIIIIISYLYRGEFCFKKKPARIGKLTMKQTVEKERKKAEKDARFAAKKVQQKAVATGPAKDKKEKKLKAEPTPPAEYVEETPPGQKKILKSLDDPAHKSYNPAVVESAWYEWWEKEGFFVPEFTADGKVKPEGVFIVPAPPPNVTGALHIGHGLTIAIQDTVIRW